MKELRRFADADWGVLLPHETIELAPGVGTKVEPMGVGDIWAVIQIAYRTWDKVVIPITAIYEEKHRKAHAKKQPQTVSFEDKVSGIKDILTESAILTVLQTEAPEVLERATGIHRGDLAKLPPVVFTKLLLTVVEVNLKDSAELEKNLVGLTGILQSLRQPDKPTHGGSEKA